MKKQCQTVALGCVRSMCGKDYTNCYRNRTDIVSGTYNTDSAKFNRSMNKMGGVLDYNIVIGLCLNTVKTSSTCEEHLKIAAAEWRETQDTNSWGNRDGGQYGAVREAWRDANTTNVDLTAGRDVLIACAISPEDAQSKEDCNAYDRAEPVNNSCDGVTDDDGCLYTEKIYQSDAEYTLTNAAKSLFQQLLVDVESEAQAKYNAKLTKEQHICLENNNGGIMGMSDNGSTFQWVKLKTSKIPKNYAAKGLATNQFTTSNDLYGSFCRARITVMSDDKDIQDQLGKDAVAYFAVGDPFTCGSWISRSTLEKISKVVGDRARKDAGEGSKKDEWSKRWWNVGGAVLGGLGGFAGMDAIQRGGGTFGGLLNPSNNFYQIVENNREAAQSCMTNVNNAKNALALAESARYSQENTAASNQYKRAVNYGNEALRQAKKLKVKGKGGWSGKEEALNGITFFTPVAYTSASYKIFDPSLKSIITTHANSCGNACGNSCISACGNNAECKSSCSICASHVNNLKNLLNGRADDNSYNAIKTAADAVKTAADTANVTACENLVSSVESSKTGLVTNSFGGEFSGNFDDGMMKNLNTIADICSSHENDEENTGARLGRNLLTGAIGARAGYLLAHGIVENYYDVQYENAENEAIKQWMDDVGSHINCYLGAEELGSYGDVITFELN